MNRLLVFRLTIQSSYADNVEQEADDRHFDTLQWWFSDNETWRIRTFAVDQDIHPHRIAGPIAEELALENTRKHYGDVIASAFVLEFEDVTDRAEVSEVMEAFGGADALEIARNHKGFAFWNPFQVRFSSKTQPA